MSYPVAATRYAPNVACIVDVQGSPVFWPHDDKPRKERVLANLVNVIASLDLASVTKGRKKDLELTRQFIHAYITGSCEGNHHIQIICDHDDTVLGCIGYWMGCSTLYDQDEAVQHDFSIVAPGLASERRAMVVDRMEKIYQNVLDDWLP